LTRQINESHRFRISPRLELDLQVPQVVESNLTCLTFPSPKTA
jgi:hypothetical protein